MDATSSGRAGRRLAAGLITAALLLGGAGPAESKIRKPEIIKAWANTQGDDLIFTVKVAMGKGKKRTWDVDVTYRGVTSGSESYREAATLFETGPFASTIRNCYRIQVKATNRRGTTKKRLNAGRQGTNGCLRDRRF